MVRRTAGQLDVRKARAVVRRVWGGAPPLRTPMVVVVAAGTGSERLVC